MENKTTEPTKAYKVKFGEVKQGDEWYAKGEKVQLTEAEAKRMNEFVTPCDDEEFEVTKKQSKKGATLTE